MRWIRRRSRRWLGGSRISSTSCRWSARRPGSVQTPAARPALLAEAAAARHWELVPQLADQGFDLNAKTTSGRTAAHLAAGTGNLEILRFLAERGADLSITDGHFQADVLGWAKWFQQPEAVKYLETL
ncbi:ankyrin repeat protein [Kribbella sp. VKM Ac-2571]|uniref:ankyrin repeat domain-containing protein n=1 Tax=Kribbella sp. VKM Ac-2571 TaxID=2512222 RepID=UPI0010CEE732|nr:ankyrin repeat domain-containing protein [Kribbella sp. VKM Ac-2571]TDO52079.1 ankyrin repeat protein [Kribbella sp. VKM Ac-2571]